MERLRQIQSHLRSTACADSEPHITAKSDDDIVIVSALRTPLTKAKKGSLKDITPDILLSHVMRAVLLQTNLKGDQLGDICVGNVLEPGAGATMARMAQLAAGIPYQVPIHVVNRQCASGLQAIATIAAGIRAGYYDIGMACGVESMSSHGEQAPLHISYDHMKDAQHAMDCMIPMGITSENVADTFGIGRSDQDAFAAQSHAKAHHAQTNGYYNAEIVPLSVKAKDGANEIRTILVSRDDGIRPQTSVKKLANLRPAFKENGSTTAGNASQVTDGAAAAILMRRKTAMRLGIPILGRFTAFSTVGVPPSIMGIGPAFAIPTVLQKANLTLEEIDVFEINEAFASQAVYTLNTLQIPKEKVNPNGGAIALGHPLGCTGVRQTTTLLHDMKRRNLRYGIVSMCVGTGMGSAAIFENQI